MHFTVDVPESERRQVELELERMIDNSTKQGVSRKFENVHYMQLVIQAMGTGKRYDSLDEALTANAPAYDGLSITNSNAGMVAGEIRRTYFRGTMENVLINGLARHDSKVLSTFLNDKLAQLRIAS